MTQKLLDSISIQLDEVFNDSTIYTEHISQNFQKNSFFLRIVKSSEKKCISNTYKLFNKVEIMYTPKSDIEFLKEINFTKQLLFQEMKILKFDTSYLFAQNMECEIKDKKLLFFIDYNFYIFRFNEVEKMQKLFSKGGLNEQQKH